MMKPRINAYTRFCLPGRLPSSLLQGHGNVHVLILFHLRKR